MRQRTTLLMAALGILVSGLLTSNLASAADAPKDRVAAMYFHRTERCPTCLKMGSYSEEAVKQGFEEQIKAGTLAFYLIDFQSPKNAALTKGYGIVGPSLIIAKIQDGKVKAYKDLQDIWTKVNDKPAFIKYVQENVTEYLK